MSSMCENPDHERCERCSGCVPCGCLCHLAGDSEEPVEAPLTLESMGLLPFMEGEGLRCPKCNTTGLALTFHETLIIVMSDEEHPCAQWTRKGLLPGRVGEHLCARCSRCGYGFPMRTAG